MSDYRIGVTFDGVGKKFTFTGDCDPAGNLAVDWGGGQEKGILFQLSAPAGCRWLGIQLAREHDRLEKAPVVRDSHDKLYEHTCFKVGPTTDLPPQLSLTDSSTLFSNDTWYYRLGVGDPDGNEFWADPKIENPGGDSTPPPGLCHGAAGLVRRQEG